jgi:heme/copper-type cytochrome/quinol oxidase subunit 4
VSSIFGLTKVVLIIAFTFFLNKKAGKNQGIQTLVIIAGSFFIALLVVFIGFSIAEGFFAK